MPNELNALSLYVAVAEVLLRPGHAVASYLQLGRKLRKTDDLVRRTLNDLATAVGQPLVTAADHRLRLTEAGRTFYRLALPLCRFAQEDAEPEAPRVVLEIDPDLVRPVLAGVLAGFLGAWPATEFRAFPFRPDRVRDHLDSGLTSFAIGLSDGTAGSREEEIETPFPWCLVGRDELSAGFDPESLAAGTRLFLPATASGLPGIEDLFYPVPPGRRVEVGSEAIVRDLTAAGLGVGLVTDWDAGASPGRPSRLIPLPPLGTRTVALYLPREPLTGPAAALLDAIRLALAPPAPPLDSPIPSLEPASEDS